MAKREISREEFIKAVRFGSMVDVNAPYKHSGYIVGWIKDKDGIFKGLAVPAAKQI